MIRFFIFSLYLSDNFLERPFSSSRHLAIHGGALTSNVLFESWLQGHLAIHGQRIRATKDFRRRLWLGTGQVFFIRHSFRKTVIVFDKRKMRPI